MSDFVARRKTYKIDIDGNIYEVRSPTIKQFESLQESLKGKSTEEVYKVYAQWLNDLGIPFSATEALDADDFIGLIKFLTEPKKK